VTPQRLLSATLGAAAVLAGFYYVFSDDLVYEFPSALLSHRTQAFVVASFLVGGYLFLKQSWQQNGFEYFVGGCLATGLGVIVLWLINFGSAI